MKENFDVLMKNIPNFDSVNYESDWRWKLLEELYANNFQHSDDKKQRIPKIIHQIWIGGTIPEKYVEWGETWKELNPGWEYRLWTDADVDSLGLLNRANYDSLLNPGPKSDVLRFHILNKFGGLYVDTDFQCLKPFEDLSYLKFYTGVGYPSKVELYPGLIGCVPGHPIMKKICQEISKVDQSVIRKKGVLAATSSGLFTEIFFENVKTKVDGVIAFPPDYFYPFPNFKGHELEDGEKYVKPCSYALHHWEVSWNKPKQKYDWVQGDKFVKIADFVYSPSIKAQDDYAKYPNTFDPEKLKDVNIVYTCIMYLARLLRILEHLPNKFIVIAHNGDQHLGDGILETCSNGKCISSEPYSIPDNVLRLYSTNVDVVHPKVDTAPLGLENDMWGSEKKEEIKSVAALKFRKVGLVYMNHGINTNREERQKVWDMFCNKPWVTAEVSRGNRKGFAEFYRGIARHKFVLNPMGNCFDNHRMWEAWYLGGIPITKRCVFTSFYEDMPMVIVDDWYQVTEEFLNAEYDRIIRMDWNKDKLRFEYWANKIKTIR